MTVNSGVTHPSSFEEGHKAPWMIFLFVTGIFFIHGHDIYTTWKGYEQTSMDVVEEVGTGALGSRIGFTLLGVTWLIALLRKKSERVRIDYALLYFIGFFGLWAALSLTWTDDQFLTLRRVVAASLFSLGAVGCAKMFSNKNIILFAFVSGIVNLLVALPVELALHTFRPWDAEYRLTGTQHPNLLAMCLGIAVISSVALFGYARRLRPLSFSVPIVTFVLLLLTKSRTSAVATLVALSAYGCLRIRPRRVFVLFLCLSISVLLSVFLLLPPDLERALHLNRATEHIGTLTNRLPLWESLMHYIAKRPLLGYGFNAFWTESRIYRIRSHAG